MEKNNPSSWEFVPLSQIAEINPRMQKGTINSDLQVSFVPMKCVEELSGQINLSNSKQYDEVKSGYTYFANGDILFAKITPCMENGKIAIAQNLKNGIGFGSTEFHVVRLLDEDMPREFYFWYLMQDKFRNNAQHNMKGTAGQLRVPVSFIENSVVPVPPLNEQKRIVSKIEELFSLIESTEETLSDVKLQLKWYRQSTLKAAFQGKITEVWREKHKSELGSAIELLERIKKYKRENNAKYKEYFPETTPSNILPDNWGWTTMGTLFDVKPGSTPSRQKAEYWNGDIPWVSSGEVSNCNINSTQEKITKSGLENSSTKIHPPGTVLLAMIGEGKTRGKAAVLKIPATTNQNVAAILCANSTILSEYVFWWLVKQYDETRRIRSGGMQYALNTERVKMLSIPLCSQKEQEEIVRELEYRISLIDSISKDIENHLFDLTRLQKTILQRAYSGKLVPRNPNDEPASILLEKIKQKKNNTKKTR